MLQIVQLCFVSVSLVRGKYEGTKENKKHIFQALVTILKALLAPSSYSFRGFHNQSWPLLHFCTQYTLYIHRYIPPSHQLFCYVLVGR